MTPSVKWPSSSQLQRKQRRTCSTSKQRRSSRISRLASRARAPAVLKFNNLTQRVGKPFCRKTGRARRSNRLHLLRARLPLLRYKNRTVACQSVPYNLLLARIMSQRMSTRQMSSRRKTWCRWLNLPRKQLESIMLGNSRRSQGAVFRRKELSRRPMTHR